LSQILRRMNLIDKIKQSAAEAMATVYDKHVATAEILINETKPEFEGDYTVYLPTSMSLKDS